MKIKWYKDKQLMNVNQKNKVTWLTYPAFEKFPGIVHGFSTRLGGVSQGIYESMNLSFTRGDEESAVRENYRRLSAAMGFSMEDIVTSDQTHTTNVRVVTEEERQRKWDHKTKTLYRCGWNDHQCAGTGAGNVLCGLCTTFLYRSGT